MNWKTKDKGYALNVMKDLINHYYDVFNDLCKNADDITDFDEIIEMFECRIHGILDFAKWIGIIDNDEITHRYLDLIRPFEIAYYKNIKNWANRDLSYFENEEI